MVDEPQNNKINCYLKCAFSSLPCLAVLQSKNLLLRGNAVKNNYFRHVHFLTTVLKILCPILAIAVIVYLLDCNFFEVNFFLFSLD